MIFLNKKTTVFIATFSPWKDGKRLPINGNLEPMVDFFAPRTKRTVLIDQVYPGSDFVIPRVEVYEKGKLKKITRHLPFIYLLYPLLKLTNKSGTRVVFKIRDFLSIISWVTQDPARYDFFIGFEAINAIAGIVLKRFGRVKTVIYYVSDYSPNRYKQKWFNNLYLWLDRFAASHADFIWDVSTAIQPARIKAGLDKEKSAPVLHVPNALYPEQIKTENMKNIEPDSIVFMGTLGIENGPDLAIEAMPYILEKIPGGKLHIVGGGEDIERLKTLVKNLKVGQSVVFHGFVSDRIEVSNMIRKFMVALAPYLAIDGSARNYGDATKIRAYLAAGLPVVTTFVPPLGKEVEKIGAAILVKDSKKELAEAVIRILSDKKLYLKMKKKAIEFAKENTWENEFNKAFKAMMIHEYNS